MKRAYHLLNIISLALSYIYITLIQESASLKYSAQTYNSDVINQAATLYFSMTLDQGVLASGDSYVLSNISPGKFTASSSDLSKCRVTFPLSVTVTQCTITSTDVTFKVSVSNSNPGTYVQFEIDNFINPPSTSSITNILLQRNSNLEWATGSLDNVQPAQMQSSSIVPDTSSTLIGMTSATIKFTFTITNTLPANGRIKVIFPIWNPDDFVNNQLTMVSTSSPSCSNGVNLDPTSCSFSSSTNELLLINVVTSDTTAPKTFSFTVNSIRNPYNSKPKTGFQIITMTSSNGMIDRDKTLTLSVTTPTVFSQLRLDISSSQIGASNVYTFTYRLNLPIDQTCRFKIKGPTEINMQTAFISGNGQSIFRNAYLTSSVDPTSNTVILNGCSQYYTQSGDSDSLTITNVQNPGQVMTTGAFTLSIYSVSGSQEYIIAQDSSTLKVLSSQLVPGTISNMAISGTHTIVQEASSYTITFKPTDNLNTNSKIIINFPTSDTFFKLTDINPCSITPISGNLIANPSGCSINNNVIILTNPFGVSSYTGGTSISFTIGTGINPISVKDAGTFTFNTFNSISAVDYQVDSGSSANLYTPTQGMISNNLGVTSSSMITYMAPVVFSITFSPAHTIPKNGLLIVTLPSVAITVFSTSLLQTQSYLNIDGGSDQTLQSITVSSNVITITDGFPTSSFQPGVAGIKVTLKLSGLRNPRSLSQTPSFQIQTQDPSGNMIDQITTGLTIAMTDINELNQVSVTPVSLINGATTNYVITVNVKTPLYNTDKFTLTFPSQITLPTSAICAAGTGVTAVTCVRSSNTITASLSFSGGQIAQDSTFSFTLQSVKNPTDTRSTSEFTNIFTTDYTDQPISKYSSSVIVQTTTPATITTASLYQADKTASTQTSYTMTITTINPIPTGGTFVIQYPSTVSMSTISTCQMVVGGVTFDLVCNLNQAASKVTMNGLSFDIIGTTAVQLIISPVQNPSDGTNTQSMIVSTYTDSSTIYIIDKASSNMVPGLLCIDPCSTCLTSDPTKCTSCYNYPSTIYKYLYMQQCLTNCPTGYYSDSLNFCQKCDYRCQTCTDSKTCSSCNTAGTYPLMNNNMCVTSCPQGTYKDVNGCYSCQSPCATCTGQSNGQCLSCSLNSWNSLTILDGNTCVYQCSSGYIPINNQCQKCISPCLTCTINQNTCTSCTQGYYLYGTGCVLNCPTGYIKNQDTRRCDGCYSNCKNCQGQTSLCIECYQNLYLFSNTCYFQCPTGYEPDVTQKTCVTKQVVTPPPTNNTNTNTNTNTTTPPSNNSTNNQTTPPQNNTNTTNNNNKSIPKNETTNNTSPTIANKQGLGFLIYCPFSLICGIGFCIALGSYFKDKSSFISSNSVALWGPFEFLALATQGYLAYQTENDQFKNFLHLNDSTNNTSQKRILQTIALAGQSSFNYGFPIILAVTGGVLIILILMNIMFSMMLCCSCSLRSDSKFIDWKRKHKRTCCCIQTWATLISFKIGKLFYSKLLGYKTFSAEFTKQSNFFKFMNWFTIINIFLGLLPIIFIDIWALSIYHWGNQFYISLIDTMIISILMLIATIIDFKVGRKQVLNDIQPKKVMDDSAMQGLQDDDFSQILDKKLNEHKKWWKKEAVKIQQSISQRNSSMKRIGYDDDDDFDKRLRRNILEQMERNPIDDITSRLRSNADFNHQVQFDDENMQSLRKRRFSDQPEAAEKEEPEQYAHSYPQTPKSYEKIQSFQIEKEPSLLAKVSSQQIVLSQKSLKTQKIKSKAAESVKSKIKSQISKSHLSLKIPSQSSYKSQKQQRTPSAIDNKWVEEVNYQDNCYAESRINTPKQIKSIPKDCDIQTELQDKVEELPNVQSNIEDDELMMRDKSMQNIIEMYHSDNQGDDSTIKKKKKAGRGKKDAKEVRIWGQEQLTEDNEEALMQNPIEERTFEEEKNDETLIKSQQEEQKSIISKSSINLQEKKQEVLKEQSQSNLTKSQKNFNQESYSQISSNHHEQKIKQSQNNSIVNKSLPSKSSLSKMSKNQDMIQSQKDDSKSQYSKKSVTIKDDKAYSEKPLPPKNLKSQASKTSFNSFKNKAQSFIQSLKSQKSSKSNKSDNIQTIKNQNSHEGSKKSMNNNVFQTQKTDKLSKDSEKEVSFQDSQFAQSQMTQMNNLPVEENQEKQSIDSSLKDLTEMCDRTEHSRQGEIQSELRQPTSMSAEIMKNKSIQKQGRKTSMRESTQMDQQLSQGIRNDQLFSQNSNYTQQVPQFNHINENIQERKAILQTEEEELIPNELKDQPLISQDQNELDKEVNRIQSKSQLNNLDLIQEEEEKFLIEEMNDELLDQPLERQEFKALSKLSKYEEELQLGIHEQHRGEETNGRNSKQRKPSSKLENLNPAPPIVDPNDGRVSAMIRKFEEENPGLLSEEDLPSLIEIKSPVSQLKDLETQSVKHQSERSALYSSVERISPQPMVFPPNPETRDFNENDILGELDRDERGNLILLENPKGQIVDKRGNLVNEKGFLIDDKNGNVIEKAQKRTVFSKSELDEQGDLPAPFNLEKYNFNPLQLFGNLEFDQQTGKPKSNFGSSNGEKKDKNNRLVNRSGFMIDKDGNIIDRKGRKKFDRRLLQKNDEMPPLLNYKGKKFDLRDILGDFDRDSETGDALIKRDKGGNLRDKQGRLVNKKGYLVDKQENIIDKRGKKIFDKCALNKEGEFPKIFGFSKFNIDQIRGDCEVDPLGNPVLFQDKKNPHIYRDSRGRRVNKKGYLIDELGNIIDKRGNKVFDKNVLTQDEDIPKVFRNGILRKDSVDSFSRIMSEIEDLERRQGSDYENEYTVSPERLKHKKSQQNEEEEEGSGGDTSYESLMEDTPSNYNIPNQRFENNYYEVEEIVEDGKEGRYDDQGKKIKRYKKKLKKRKKKKVQETESRNNNERDLLMSLAYGEISKRGTQMKIPSTLNQQALKQSKLSNLANSISGFYKDKDVMFADGLSSRMKESEVARKIPNFKDRKLNLKRRDSENDWDQNPNGSGSSMQSYYSQSNANFNQMMNQMSGNFSRAGQNSNIKSNIKLRGMENIYLQRLEPTAGKKVKATQLKARFRECHDRVHNDPDLIAEDLTVKEQLDTLITENLSHIAQIHPQTTKYIDMKRIKLIKEKLLKESAGSKNSGQVSLQNEFDEDGSNIFHGNRRQYEREQIRQPKINIGKNRKF